MRESSRRICHQIAVFIICFLLYSSLHCCRASWSYSKSEFKNDPNYLTSSEYLGTVDFIFLLCYGLGMYMFGWLGDKFDLRIFLTVCLFGTGLIFGSIAISNLNGFHNLYFIATMMGLNGFFQSLGWPGCISCLANWLPHKNRAILMGVWAGCQNFGNIVGFEIGTLMIDRLKIGWSYAVLTSALYCFFMGFLVITLLKPYPEKIGINCSERIEHSKSILDERLESETSNDEETNVEHRSEYIQIDPEHKVSSVSSENKCHGGNSSIGFFKAWTIPGVPFFVLAYACTKGSCYGILFWLAPYLKEGNQENYASTISQVNEVGQFIGGFVLGILVDKIGRKGLLLPIYLISAAVFFVLISELADSTAEYFVYLFFGGFSLGGPYNMIGSAIAADLAKNPQLKANKKSLSTVSAIILGSGSLTAAGFQRVIPFFEKQMFLFFAGVCLLGALIVIPLAYGDVKDLMKKNPSEALLDKQNMENSNE